MVLYLRLLLRLLLGCVNSSLLLFKDLLRVSGRSCSNIKGDAVVSLLIQIIISSISAVLLRHRESQHRLAFQAFYGLADDAELTGVEQLVVLLLLTLRVRVREVKYKVPLVLMHFHPARLDVLILLRV